MWDYIVIEPDPPAETKGTLIVAIRAQKPTYRGTVVAVGPGIEDDDGDWEPTSLSVGDRICHLPFNLTKVEIGNRVWYLIREKDVLCRIS